MIEPGIPFEARGDVVIDAMNAANFGQQFADETRDAADRFNVPLPPEVVQTLTRVGIFGRRLRFRCPAKI
jgi:hypothetical protein